MHIDQNKRRKLDYRVRGCVTFSKFPWVQSCYEAGLSCLRRTRLSALNVALQIVCYAWYPTVSLEKKVSCSVLLLQCLCASQVHAQNTIVPSESVIEYC